MGECTVSSVQKVRSLGVIFDENLSVNDYVSNVCRKGFYQLNTHYDKSGNTSPLNVWFMTSHIDYGNVMLFGLPDVKIKKLKRPKTCSS